MPKQWKCLRCGTANPESSVSCLACGAIRGAVVTAPAPSTMPLRAPSPAHEPAAPPPPSSAVPPPPGATGRAAPRSALWSGSAGMPPDVTVAPPRSRVRLPIGLIVFVGLVAFGAISGWLRDASRSSSGDINKAGELAPSELRVGDCFDLAEPTASDVDKTNAKPCAQPHGYELIFTGAMPAGDYPSEAAFEAYVITKCYPAFAAYVGVNHQDSVFDILWFYPSADAWRTGNRTFACSVYDEANSQLTGSVKNARR